MTKYAYVDMHIHTALSNEEGANLSVKETFDKAIREKFKYGLEGKMLLSITDHNSSLSSLEAREILQDPKYSKHIKYINGIEFTTHLKELDGFTSENGKRLYTRCHMLAYNYDENEPNLMCYSRLTHMHFGECNIGQQIIALREVWKKYGIDLEFKDFVNVLDAKTTGDAVIEFFSLLKSKCDKSKIEALLKECNDFITYTYNRDATSMGRLTLLEVCKLVKDAGGDLFLAHPSTIKRGLVQVGYIQDRELKTQYFEEFINLVQSITNNALKGIECFYPDVHKCDCCEVLIQLAQKHDLYISAGTDYHGPILNRHRQPGEVLNYYFCDFLKQDRTDPKRFQMFVKSLRYLDYGKDDPKDKTRFEIYDSDNKLHLPADLYRESSDYYLYYRKYLAENKEMVSVKTFKPKNITSIEDHAKNMQGIIDRFEKLLLNIENPSEKYKLMMDLNLFVASILKATSKARKFIARLAHKKDFFACDFTTGFFKSRKKYYKLKKFNKDLVDQCIKDMKTYYNIDSKTLALDDFFDLKF